MLDTGVAYTNADASGSTRPRFATTTASLYPALGDLTLTFVAAPELAPASRFVAPRDFIWDDNAPLDFDGHGTHVSGTIGQLHQQQRRARPAWRST